MPLKILPKMLSSASSANVQPILKKQISPKIKTTNTDRKRLVLGTTLLPRFLDQRGRPQGCLCRICRSPNASAINMALLAGEPLRSLEERTGHSKSSLQCHKNHIPPMLVAAANSKKTADATTVASELCELVELVRGIRAQAFNDGDMRVFFSAAAREQALIGIKQGLTKANNRLRLDL